MSLLTMIQKSGNVVTRRVSAAAFQWMLAVSSAVDTLVTSGAGTQAQIRYVRKDGNDATGTGSFANPFLTIQAAITAITDATSVKQYTVNVGAGVFATAFTLKPWVFIQGQGIDVTTIAPTAANVLSAAFAGAGTQSTGIADVTSTTALVANFALVGSTGAGNIDLHNVECLAALTIVGNNIANAAYLSTIMCRLTPVTFTNMGVVDCTSITGSSGLVNLNINGSDAYFSSVQIMGSGTFGTVTVTWTGANAANLLDVSFFNSVNFAANNIVIVGIGAFVSGNTNYRANLTDANQEISFYNGGAAAVKAVDGALNMFVMTPTVSRSVQIDAPFAIGTRVNIRNKSGTIFMPLTFVGGTSTPQSYIAPLSTYQAFWNGAAWEASPIVQGGTVTLSNGVSALIPADVTAGSNIVASLRDFNAGVLGAMISAKLAGRIVGTRAGGGGFVLTSVTTAGATVATDQGIYDWTIQG